MKRQLLAVAALLWALPAHAQNISPFVPTGYTVSALSTTVTNSTASLPVGTQSVLAQNVGSDAVICAPGPTATVNGIYLAPSGGSFIFSLNGYTQISCLDQNTTSTVNLIPGSGYAISTSGGGGGGSSTVIPNPLPISGTVTANIGTAGTLATAANQTTANSSLATIATNTGASIPAGANLIGSVTNDPCTTQVKTNVAIAASTGTIQLVAGASAKKVYVCFLKVIGQAAWVGNIIEGTGAACATANEAAVEGSTTAASGESFLASDGFVEGSGEATVLVTGTAANGICILQSGTAALAGTVAYVQQ